MIFTNRGRQMVDLTGEAATVVLKKVRRWSVFFSVGEETTGLILL